MFTKLLQRNDVYILLREIYKSNVYSKKDNNVTSSSTFKGQPLFILFDALFKYAIIIEDEKYLNNYVFQLGQIFRRVDNIYDIFNGINKLICKTVALKLKIEDMNLVSNKKKILEYIYDRYIVNGYVMHGYNGVYKKKIEKYGLDPENYDNYYFRFMEMDKIFTKNGIAEVITKNFNQKCVYFTDGFYMSCYYGANSPNYFYQIFAYDFDNYKDEYYKNDYFGCFANLNKLIKKAKLSTEEKKLVLRYCLDEWKILDKNNTDIDILLIKRKTVGLDSLKNIDQILNGINDTDLDVLVGKIIDCNNDRIKITNKIDSKDIYYITIPNYNSLFDAEKERVDKAIKQKRSVERVANAYGKVSALVLFGSILITLGVIITIVMFLGMI